MKICFQNKIPILTKDINPSWNCTDSCCFRKFLMDNSVFICHELSLYCTSEYVYTLQDNISDIFTL